MDLIQYLTISLLLAAVVADQATHLVHPMELVLMVALVVVVDIDQLVLAQAIYQQ